MTPAQQSAIEDVVGRPLSAAEIDQIAPLVSEGNVQAIAEIVSIGRKKLVPTECGAGTILEVLGITAGNALLDVIYNMPEFRYVKPLVEQGRLRLDSPLTIASLQALVGTVLTQAQADALKARAELPDPIRREQVTAALYG